MSEPKPTEVEFVEGLRFSERGYKAGDGWMWTAGPYTYNGSGVNGQPKVFRVDLVIEESWGSGSCSHEIELTRADIVALGQLMDLVEKEANE